MNIAYVSELNFEGKPALERQSNWRTDTVWQDLFDSYHFNYFNCNPKDLEDFDIVVINYPKNKDEDIKLLEKFKGLDTTVGLLQHGAYDNFMRWGAEAQVAFFDFINQSDFFLATNKPDQRIYEYMCGTDVFYFKTAIKLDKVNKFKTEQTQDLTYVGGNMVRWYGGSISLQIAEKFGNPILMPEMGQHQPDETAHVNDFVDVEVRQHPYLQWDKWVEVLSKCKYAVHMMPVAGCGSFHLTTAALSIPNIGRDHVTTQKKCFPDELCITEEFKKIDSCVDYVETNYEQISKKAKEKAKQFRFNKVQEEILDFFRDTRG